MGITTADAARRIEMFIESVRSSINSPIPDYEKIIFRDMSGICLSEYDSFFLEDDDGMSQDSLEESQKMLFDFLGVSQ